MSAGALCAVAGSRPTRASCSGFQLDPNLLPRSALEPVVSWRLPTGSPWPAEAAGTSVGGRCRQCYVGTHKRAQSGFCCTDALGKTIARRGCIQAGAQRLFPGGRGRGDCWASLCLMSFPNQPHKRVSLWTARESPPSLLPSRFLGTYPLAPQVSEPLR